MPYQDPITKISELEPSKPAGSEPRSVIDDVIRQLKGFLVSFLSKIHTDEGDLKPKVVKSGNLDAGVVRGSAGDGVQKEILYGSVGTRDIAFNSITSSHLASSAVTEAKIATAAVGTSKIANRAVTSEKIEEGAIVAGKIASGAISGNNIVAGVITNEHLAASAVTGDNVASATIQPDRLKANLNNSLLVGDGATFKELPVASDSAITLTVSGGALKFKLGSAAEGESGSVRGFTLLQERKNRGQSGGPAAANTWNLRNSGGSMVVVRNIGQIVEPVNSWFKILVDGSYWIRAWAVAYNVGVHRLALCRRSDQNWVLVVIGSGGPTSTGDNSVAFIETVQDFKKGEEYALLHYSQNANNVDGLGKETNLLYGTTALYELYAEVSLTLL